MSYKQIQNNYSLLEYCDEDWYNGSIKSITLENFMCHSNFHLPLNPRINFISGLNGSGKSAVQTALVVGFGSRASTTNRGNSLKTLIKYGCPKATISITIANGGIGNLDNAPFKPEVYGRQITLVRQITESGNNPLKFLNENGRVVKGGKNELKKLTLHFNIMIDNPICVMNQAMVKTFHKSTNPEAKYQLFYKAISANVYHDNIEKTIQIGNENSKKLEQVKIVMDQCFKEVNEYEIYENKIRQLDKLSKSKTQLENEFAWKLVSKYKHIYEDCLQEIELLQDNISKGTDKTILLKENVKTSSETLLKKKTELKNVDTSRSRNHFELLEKTKELNIKTNELDMTKQSIQKYESSLKMLINDRKDLEGLIEVERQKGNTNTLAQYKEMIYSYEQNISEVEAAWKTHMEHEKTIRNTVDDLIQKIETLKSKEMTPMQYRVIELDRNISSMSQQKNSITFYGNWMPKLVQTIDNAFKQNKFSKKPIGPIGSYIKVNNDKWIFSIENHLGRATLRTFLVDNFEDNKVLQSIMEKVIPENVRKPSVITSKFFENVHNIAARKTYNSMFSMLTFTSPVVANCLIDNNRIETIMLVDNTAEAMPLMENATKVPKNCNFSLTLDGTQVYPSPSYRVYSLQNSCEPVLLQRDVSVAVNNLRQEKKELEEKIKNLNREFESLEKSKSKNEDHFKKTNSETRFLKLKYDEYTKKINSLKVKCEEAQDDRMGNLTDEMNEINLRIDRATKALDDVAKPISKYEKEIAEIKEKLHDINLVIENTDRFTILEEIEALQSQIDKYNTELFRIENSLVEQTQKLSDLKKKAGKDKKTLENNQNGAQNLCEQIEVTRSEEDIQRDIKETIHKYQALEMELKKREGDHLVLRSDYMRKKKEFYHQRTLFKKVRDIYMANKNCVELSKIALYNYIKYIRFKVTESFDLVLRLRKIKGRLDINQEDETMIITMFDNISTSCASGGERTFATVALILALWSNMQLPFYSIDEYDVYMDNVNRLATTQLLMIAIENRKNQFIFLTPQDISHIKSAANVKIVQLKEPRS